MHRTAELGAKHEAAAFKKAKPEIKVLFYFNAAYAWPYTSYNQDFTRQRIEARPELKEFLIIHPNTGKLADRYGAFCFDVLNPDFRDYGNQMNRGRATISCRFRTAQAVRYRKPEGLRPTATNAIQQPISRDS